jgi:hypothetical protein
MSLEVSMIETRSSMTPDTCDSSEPTPKLKSALLCLPQELRTLCFKALLESTSSEDATFGKGSGLDLSILSVCRSVHDEVSELLYSKAHRIIFPCGSTRSKNRSQSMRPKTEPVPNIVSIPPSLALPRLKHIRLEINFKTDNRGECEMNIMHYQDLLVKIQPISMTLLRSECLRSLTIGLFNHAQRKVGNRRLRSRHLLSEMKWLLRPFAYLPRQVSVLIDGFDTIEYADMFEALREEHAGESVPVTEWLEETLNADMAGPSGARDCTYRPWT